MYTTHGHQIQGTPVEGDRPEFVARCGGPGLCTKCCREAVMATNEATVLATTTQEIPPAQEIKTLYIGDLVMIYGRLFRLTSAASFHDKPATATLEPTELELTHRTTDKRLPPDRSWAKQVKLTDAHKEVQGELGSCG